MLSNGKRRARGNNVPIRRMLLSERNSFPRLLALTAAGLLLAALPILSAPAPALAAPDALIVNTGSTNTTGYRIYVSPSGKVSCKSGAATLSTETHYTGSAVPKVQTKQFFKDLTAAMPLTDLPVRHGMRSASFGTETYVTYKGQKSPDLTFASDPRTIALKADIDAITKTLHIGNAPRRPIVIHSDR